jgi:hypothetical protein
MFSIGNKNMCSHKEKSETLYVCDEKGHIYCEACMNPCCDWCEKMDTFCPICYKSVKISNNNVCHECVLYNVEEYLAPDNEDEIFICELCNKMITRYDTKNDHKNCTCRKATLEQDFDFDLTLHEPRIKMPKPFCPPDVIPGSHFTKEKRQESFGNVAGGSGSCKPEQFQREKIIEGTGVECSKTNTRINVRTKKLIDISHPNKKSNGYDFTENFDGLQIKNKKKIYINLKCIVGQGGNQTRSLREVYWFIEGQLEALLLKEKDTQEEIYFANILDGDEAFRNFDKFEYLLSLEIFQNIKNRVYVGDLKGYFFWFTKNVCE